MSISPREYQIDALDRTAAAEARGVRRQLGVAATGLGKTVIFASLAKQRGRRTLILAHRDELVAQAVSKVREIWPDADVGVVKGSDDEVSSQVVVASVQTLSRERRLARLLAAVDGRSLLADPVEPFDLVVVDEAHHASAETYRRIIDGLGAGTETGPLLLGVTATPDRGDGRGLDDVFGEIVWTYDMLWGIRSGYLSDLRGLRVSLDQLDLSSVKVSKGDYEAGSAGRAMEDAQAPTVICAAWREHARDRRTIVFTPTVSLAHLVAEEFRSFGISAEAVSGSTEIDERRAMLRRYASGETQVIVNCAVLTEGFDEPRTDCIVVARPTKSRALYTQMVGRGTRRHPDKTDCLVLDVVGASMVHSLVTIPSLFGVGESEFAERLGDGSENVTELLDRRDQALVALGKLTAAEADLFHKIRRDGIVWVPLHAPGARKHYVRGLGPSVPGVELIENENGTWTSLIGFPGKAPDRMLIVDGQLETAQGVAEDYVRKNGVSAFIEADAPWRSRRPTSKQVAAAEKWKMPVDPSWTAGQLSEALDAHIARKLNRRPTR